MKSKIKIKSIEDYLLNIPENRKLMFTKLRETILKNLPKGFEETISYGMISYVVPHSIYPSGYHCKPEEPLPFISIANQKNHIAIHHMGIYADEKLLKWFQSEFKKASKGKLDMSKSCIRFKKFEDIPFELIGKLVAKVSVKEWINLYESKLRKNIRRKNE